MMIKDDDDDDDNDNAYNDEDDNDDNLPPVWSLCSSSHHQLHLPGTLRGFPNRPWQMKIYLRTKPDNKFKNNFLKNQCGQ